MSRGSRLVWPVGRNADNFAGMTSSLAASIACALLLQSAAPAPGSQGAPEQDARLRALQDLYEQRRYQDAAKLGEELVRERPEDPDAWLALALVHLAPDWAGRRDARAESAGLRARRLAPDRPDVLAALAQAKYHQTKYDDALPILDRLLDSKPPMVSGAAAADLLVTRAEIVLKRDALEPEAGARARADLDRAIAAAPGAASARVVRAQLRYDAEEFDAALEDLKVAVAVLPGSKRAHFLMRSCLMRLGRRDEASRHYEIYTRLNRLTDSTALTSAPDAAERRRILRELRELNPADLDHRLMLASTELELLDFDAAIAECDALLALDPGWPPARHVRESALRRKASAGGAKR